MTDDLVCWRCGASLQGLLLPFGRRAECLACKAEIHVCRMCRFYDPNVAKSCREPIAEEVQDKERANFCGYFEPRPRAYVPRDAAAGRTAKARLDALFGDRGAGTPSAATPADRAREELGRLFGAVEKKDES
jgi:hypothetical protein